MKKLIFLFFMVFASKTYSQIASPTFGQVFDFAIGDTFEYSTGQSSLEECIHDDVWQQIILDKQIINDTVSYQIKRTKKVLSYRTGPNCNYGPYMYFPVEIDSIVERYIISDTVRRLFSLIGSSAIFTDTVYYETQFGGSKLAYKLELNLNYHLRKYVEGLGMTDSIEFPEGPPGNHNRYWHLTYFHKGNEIWGTSNNRMFNVGIVEPSSDNLIAINNPFTTNIHINIIEKFDNNTMIEVYDLLGNLLLITRMDAPNFTIQTNNWQNGYYTIRIQNKSGLLYHKKILKIE